MAFILAALACWLQSYCVKAQCSGPGLLLWAEGKQEEALGCRGLGSSAYGSSGVEASESQLCAHWLWLWPLLFSSIKWTRLRGRGQGRRRLTQEAANLGLSRYPAPPGRPALLEATEGAPAGAHPDGTALPARLEGAQTPRLSEARQGAHRSPARCPPAPPADYSAKGATAAFTPP